MTEFMVRAYDPERNRIFYSREIAATDDPEQVERIQTAVFAWLVQDVLDLMGTYARADWYGDTGKVMQPELYEGGR